METGKIKKANPYQIFALIYDKVMDHVNYRHWFRFIAKLAQKNGINLRKASVLEIGCGTGKMLRFFYGLSPRLYGIDISQEMLKQARQKLPRAHIFVADMRSFNLPEKFDLIICVHDTINYLLSYKELLSTFLNAARHLKPSGLFFVDAATPYNVKKNFHRKVFKGSFNGIQYIWNNFYDEESRIIKSELTFCKKGGNFVEVHLQKIFKLKEIKKALKEAGFSKIKVYADYLPLPPFPVAYSWNFAAML